MILQIDTDDIMASSSLLHHCFSLSLSDAMVFHTQSVQKTDEKSENNTF
jgi:hypothetical protein